MPEGTKSLDEAMLETLGKATEEAEADPAEAPEAPAQEQDEAVPEQEAQQGGPEETPEASVQEEKSEAQAAQAPKDGKQAAAPAKDGKAPAAAAKPPKAGTPIGWPPELHGEFYKLPRPVKNQILKQQGEMARERATYQKKAKEYDETSKRLSGFESALAPFVPRFQALGVEPVAAVKELLQVEHVLAVGNKAQKAQVVANIIQTQGVDIAALAAILKGETQPEGGETRPPPPPQRRPEEVKDPRVDAMVANANRIRQQQEQRAKAEAEAARQQSLLEFQELAASGEAPYFDRVLKQMVAVNAAALETGEALTPKEVYERACFLNPEVRNLVNKAAGERKAQEAQRSQQARTRQAVNAASSVKTEPGAPAGARMQTLDEAILGLATRYGG